MQLTQAVEEIRNRIQHPRGTNLIYLSFAASYAPRDPAYQVAEALGIQSTSVIQLLIERFGDAWERLLAAESERRLQPVTAALAQALLDRVKSAPCCVVCDTEVLYALPDLNLTAWLYPLSSDHVIVVSVKASPVASGLRLLGDGPVYPTGNCAVLEVQEEGRHG